MACDHKTAIATLVHAFTPGGGVRLEVDIDSLCGECMSAVVHRYRSTCQCNTIKGMQIITGHAPSCAQCGNHYVRVVEFAPRR